MGKHDKKQRRQQRNGRRGNFNYHEHEDGGFDCSSMASALCLSDNDEERPVEDEELDEQNEEVGNVDNTLADLPSKFLLYQQSVQVQPEPFIEALYCTWCIGIAIMNT